MTEESGTRARRGGGFKYVYPGMVGERDTRHEAIGDLAKYGDWNDGDVVPISEDCLVSQPASIIVGPIHLGDKYFDDRDWFATKHGAVRINQEQLVRVVNGDEQEVVESEWYADCPICGQRVSVSGMGEDARRGLTSRILNHCGTEWFPPSDWVEDCDVCGDDHRGEFECKPPAYRTPSPSVDDDFTCARCGWDGSGDELHGHAGECPNCDSPAVTVVEP
jgi:hypothetical protein